MKHKAPPTRHPNDRTQYILITDKADPKSAFLMKTTKVVKTSQFSFPNVPFSFEYQGCENAHEKEDTMREIRTIKKAHEEIKRQDPRTAVTEYLIRHLCKKNIVDNTMIGNKILVYMDSLNYVLGMGERG